MKREITMKRDYELANNVFELVSLLLRYIMMPFELLRSYYSSCLGKEVGLRQTFDLLHLQIAFLFAVFPVSCAIWLRLIFVAWFVAVLYFYRAKYIEGCLK